MLLKINYDYDNEQMAKKIIENHEGNAEAYFLTLFKNKKVGTIDNITFDATEIENILNEYQLSFHEYSDSSDDWELVADAFDFNLIDKVLPFCDKFNCKPEVNSVYIEDGFVYGTDTRILIRKKTDMKFNVHIPYYFIDAMKRPGATFKIWEHKKLSIFVDGKHYINHDVNSVDLVRVIDAKSNYKKTNAKNIKYYKTNHENLFALKSNGITAFISQKNYDILEIRKNMYNEMFYEDTNSALFFERDNTLVCVMPVYYSSEEVCPVVLGEVA